MPEPQVPSGGPRPRLPAGETLIFDADDTLWENNIYFELATDAFLDYLAHSQLSHVQARAILNDLQRGNRYGSQPFAPSLQEAFRHPAPRDLPPAHPACLHTL